MKNNVTKKLSGGERGTTVQQAIRGRESDFALSQNSCFWHCTSSINVCELADTLLLCSRYGGEILRLETIKIQRPVVALPKNMVCRASQISYYGTSCVCTSTWNCLRKILYSVHGRFVCAQSKAAKELPGEDLLATFLILRLHRDMDTCHLWARDEKKSQERSTHEENGREEKEDGWERGAYLVFPYTIWSFINLFAEQDKHLSKVNTTTQIVVQVRLMLMKKLNLSDHITWNTKWS